MAPSDPASESTPAPSSVALSSAAAERGGPSTAKVLGILLGVFVFGGLAGGFAGRAITLAEFRRTVTGSPGEVRAKWRIEALRREIELTDQQVGQLTAIMKESEPDRDAAMKPCRPDIDALRAKTDAKILEILTPAQRPKYEEYVKRRQQR